MGLNPSDKALEALQKPINKSGQNCPLWRKPVAKVCHTCEFWQPCRLTVNGQEEIIFKCSFNWQPTLLLLNQQTMEMVERESTATRAALVNFAGEANKMVSDLTQAQALIDVAKKIDQIGIQADGETKQLSGPAA